MSLKILQLSDLHIGEQKEVFDLEEFSQQIILADTGAPDIILVTGDIFDGKAFGEDGYQNLIEEAAAFFTSLIEALNKEYKIALSKESIYFLPGNHEVNQKGVKTGEDKFLRYREFLDLFYEKNRPEHYFEKELSLIKVFTGKKVILIGFSSPSYGKNQSGEYEFFGMIKTSQLNEVRAKLREIENYEDYQIVVALHHHFYMIEERDKRYIDASALRNSEQFFKFLLNYNICAILHGHKHETLNRRLNLNLNIQQPDKMVTVLGCGTATKEQGIYSNSMNFIEVYDPGLKYDLKYDEYIYSRSDFSKEKSASLPLGESRKFSLNIQEEINECPELSKRHTDLMSADRFTQKENYRMLDDVVGSLPSIAEQLIADPEIFYYLLGAVHYRSNIRYDNNDLNHVDDFMKTTLSDHFTGIGNEMKELLNTAGIYDLYDGYKKVKESCKSETQKKYLVFLVLGIALIEFYKIIKYEADEFFDLSIQKKAGFIATKEEIKNGIVGNSITFKSDEDRRSMVVFVKCKTAIAHKVTSLIIKEFELILLKFEHDFAAYGFKIYHILPELTKQVSSNNIVSLESYHFSAYIPTLIPLLAGRNIYNQPEAFIRELIQNALDAVAVRTEKDSPFEPKIEISFGEKDGLQYIEISDNGSGMDKYILERYLTTAGRSFYTSEDFDKLEISHKPISQFGIGFLSCFILGKHVTVDTMHHVEQKPYFLDIPNFDGCYFIEEGSRTEPGTTIRIYENPDLEQQGLSFERQRIQEYIIENIYQTNFPVYVNNKLFSDKHILKNRLKQKTKKNKLLFFIPVIWKNGQLVVDKEKHSNYGIYFYVCDNNFWGELDKIVLNCGILVKNSNKMKTFIDDQLLQSFGFCADFPSNVLHLDVSRDTLRGLESIDWDGIKEELKLKLSAHLAKDENIKGVPYSWLNISGYQESLFDQFTVKYIEEKQKFIIKVDTDIHKSRIKSMKSFLTKGCELFGNEQLKQQLATIDSRRIKESDLEEAFTEAIHWALRWARERLLLFGSLDTEILENIRKLAQSRVQTNDEDSLLLNELMESSWEIAELIEKNSEGKINRKAVLINYLIEFLKMMFRYESVKLDSIQLELLELDLLVLTSFLYTVEELTKGVEIDLQDDLAELAKNK